MTGRGTGCDQPASDRTRRRHRVLAESVRLVLHRRYTEPVPLREIAADLGVSPCFLCRVFRRETGATIHGYLSSLRLTRALELLDGRRGENLSMLALDLGFASHSHFTRAFCRKFGAPPSIIRGHLLEQSSANPEQDRASAASGAGPEPPKAGF